MFKLLYNNNNESDNSIINLSIDIINDEEITEQRTIGFINKNIKDTGGYLIIINPDNINGANGVYCISRSDRSKYGIVKNLCGSNGLYNECIELKWEPYEYPKLVLRDTKLKTNKRTLKLSYTIKIVF